MSQLEQFDVVILGSREKAEQAILASEQQGQKVLLIDLDPHVIASLICQETLSSNMPPSKGGKIVVHKQEVHTPLHKTTTLVLQTEMISMEQELLHESHDELVEDILLADEENETFEEPIVITAQLSDDLRNNEQQIDNILQDKKLEDDDTTYDLELELEENYFDSIEEFDPTPNHPPLKQIHEEHHSTLSTHSDELTMIYLEEEKDEDPIQITENESHLYQVQTISLNDDQDTHESTIIEAPCPEPTSPSTEVKRNRVEPIVPSLLWTRENSLKDRLTKDPNTKIPKSGLQDSLTSHLFERLQKSEKKNESDIQIDLTPSVEEEDMLISEQQHSEPAESDRDLDSTLDIEILEETEDQAADLLHTDEEVEPLKGKESNPPFQIIEKEPQPAYIERDIRLRKRFSQSGPRKFSLDSFDFFNKKLEPESEIMNESLEQNESVQPESLKQSKKVDSIQKGNITPPTIEDVELTTPSNLSEMTTDLEEEIFTLEAPFAPRRRSRFQKKSRLIHNFDLNSGKDSTSELKKKKLETKDDLLPFDHNSFSFDDDLSAEFDMPDNMYDEDLLYGEEADLDSPSTKQNSGLKSDEIEFEDAYGYNSWEEFLTPFSQNSRKRQEMDKIEKRKLALRGLHNLINNLG